MAILGLISCGAEVDDSTLPSNGAGSAAVASAVTVEAAGCSLLPAIGTGAILDEPELVITVAHTVAGARSITVIDGHGERFPASLSFIDPASDVAILRVAELTGTPLALTSPEPPVNGHLLVMRDGTPTAEPIAITRKLNVTIEDIYIDTSVERTALEFTGAVTTGDSGGAILVDGGLAGIVYARSRHVDDLGFALDYQELSDALDAVRLLDGDRGPAVEPGDCVP